MSDEPQEKWLTYFDIGLKVLTGIFIPITILVAGHWLAAQQQASSEASLKQQQEAALAERNADRAANLLSALASDNPRERTLAIRTIEFLIRENKFPAELGPALISVSLSDTDPEVAQAAAEVLPQAYKANPELEKASIVETQRVLKTAGYYTGEVDGQNGESTKEALRKFQQEHGIKADGAMQPATMQKLRDLKQRRPGDASQNQPAPSTGADTRSSRPTLRGRR